MVEELIKILWHPVEPSMSFFCVFIALLCMETALNECLTICEIRMESFWHGWWFIRAVRGKWIQSWFFRNLFEVSGKFSKKYLNLRKMRLWRAAYGSNRDSFGWNLLNQSVKVSRRAPSHFFHLLFCVLFFSYPTI